MRRGVVHAQMTAGYVYVVEGSRGVKIGWSAQPLRRIASLERAEHEDLYVWAIVEGTRADERRLHARWTDARLEGEWFTATEELLVWAERFGRRLRASNRRAA